MKKNHIALTYFRRTDDETGRIILRFISEMTPAQRQAIIDTQPIVSIEGHVYSPQNQCMIALQMPGATVMGGFQQWITAGRSVKKGEHGACIWIPIGRGPKGEDSTPTTEASETESTDGGRSGFTLGSVFDITQTQSKEEKEAAQAQEEKAADMAEVTDHETPGSSFLALEMEVHA